MVFNSASAAGILDTVTVTAALSTASIESHTTELTNDKTSLAIELNTNRALELQPTLIYLLIAFLVHSLVNDSGLYY